jgi:hypothetical protein
MHLKIARQGNLQLEDIAKVPLLTLHIALELSVDFRLTVKNRGSGEKDDTCSGRYSLVGVLLIESATWLIVTKTWF